MIARKARGSEQDRALIESFLDMMSAERGASENTIAAYRRDILDFAQSAARAGSDLKTAGREEVRAGATVLPAGTRLGPAEMSLAAPEVCTPDRIRRGPA